MPDPNIVASPGGAVGGKVAKLLADATIYTRQRMSPHQANLAQKVLADFTNHVSDELRDILGPLWAKLADDEETPEELRHLFKVLETERGQAFAWMAQAIGGTAISGGLGAILNNMLARPTQAILAGDPLALISPEQSARLDIVGAWSTERAQSEALRSGVSRERLQALKVLALTELDPSSALHLWRRGHIDQSAFERYLRRAGYESGTIRDMLTLKREPLTPDQLAGMWNRSIVTTAEGERIAAASGMAPEDFRKLTELGGDPLPPVELGEAYRRGFIDRARFNRGIVQGPLRNEWFDVLERLQIHRMSTVDAADAANQGHMSETEARRIARENGLDPDDFSTLLKTAGQPPGIEFAAEAWNRGLISDSDYDVMFLESRIKNRYLPLLRKMRTRIIPQETVRLLYREGVYSREETLRTLLEHGFSDTDAAALIAVEESRGETGTRELTRAQVVAMYGQRMLSQVDTVEMLLGLGYGENDARAMIELADLQHMHRFVNAAITRVRSSFLAGKIDANEASAQLDRFGVPVGQRDDMLALWDIDRTTVTKTLTASQIRQAVTKDLITEGEGVKRLVDQGYTNGDASLFLQLTS